MSLFGSLFTAVSGLSAQSQETAMISNNIANVDTVGFKSNNAAFFSLVTTSVGDYSPGTVSVDQVQNIGLEGTIQQTSSSTDAAISGNGFFTVKADDNSSSPFLYTRSGSFSEDSTGLLRNSAGQVLYAWPLSSTGALPSNQGDVASLVPANVSFLGGLTKPTTTASLSLNLNADQNDTNLETAATPSNLPVNNVTTPPDYTRALTVYDSLGSAQNLTFQFSKIVGPMSYATSQTSNTTDATSLTDTAKFPNVKKGDSFTVSVGTDSRTYVIGEPGNNGETEVDTMGDLVNDINTNFAGGDAANASLNAGGQLVIQAVNPKANMTLTNVIGNPLGGTGNSALDLGSLDMASQPGTTGSSTSYATSTGAGLTNASLITAAFPSLSNGSPFGVKIGATTHNFTVGAAPADNVGDLIANLNTQFGAGTASLDGNGQLDIQASNATDTVSFTGLAAGDTTSGTAFSLNYTPQAAISGGTYTTYPGQTDFPQIANVTDPNTSGWWQVSVTKPDGTTLTQGLMNFNGDGTLNAADDATGSENINLNGINWNNGSEDSNISVNVGAFTQYAGDYNVVSSDQNGAALGLRTGVEITSDGTIVAEFSNGGTSNLYKIPLSTFANPNGLEAVSGTAYSETSASGADNLREAGEGGAGTLTADALEGSNVDLADEFSKLIVTQNAYAANTKVVSTVDSMTQDLLQIVNG